jgi:hypothetical protein
VEPDAAAFDDPAPVDPPHAFADASRDRCCSRLSPTQLRSMKRTSLLRSRSRPPVPRRAVVVVRDPGYGFGDAARHCVMAHRYKPAWTLPTTPFEER